MPRRDFGARRHPPGTALQGELYLFAGRDCRRAKVLYFDGTGLCLFHKRLEQGRFARLWRQPQVPRLELSLPELQLFLQGCALIGTQRLSPAPLSPSALFSSSSAPPSNDRT